MDGIIKLAQSYIENSVDTYGDKSKSKPNKWKYCVALEKAGYSAECSIIDGKPGLQFKWIKNGEDDIVIHLSLVEQGMWLNYLDLRTNRESDL